MRLNKRIICADGFDMSVQANENAYCSPRISSAARYSAVEIGYPSDMEEMLLPYAENPEQPSNTVYAYVPASVVSLVIAKHGGIVDGELPNGIPYLKEII